MSAERTTHVFRGSRRVNAAFAAPAPLTTWDVCQGLAARLNRFGAKKVARACKVSERTAENWIQGTAAPQARYILSMLRDRELASEVLSLAGRDDLANADVVLKSIESLDIALDGLRVRDRQ